MPTLPVPTGTVNITISGMSAGSSELTPDSDGVGSDYSASENAGSQDGTFPVVASYSGDSNYAPFTQSGTLTITTQTGTGVVTMTLVINGGNPVFAGSQFNISGEVTPVSAPSTPALKA